MAAEGQPKMAKHGPRSRVRAVTLASKDNPEGLMRPSSSPVALHESLAHRRREACRSADDEWALQSPGSGRIQASRGQEPTDSGLASRTTVVGERRPRQGARPRRPCEGKAAVTGLLGIAPRSVRPALHATCWREKRRPGCRSTRAARAASRSASGRASRRRDDPGRRVPHRPPIHSSARGALVLSLSDLFAILPPPES